MHKLIFLLIFTGTFLFSANIVDKNVKILAAKVSTKENVLIAKGDVIIYSKTYYITANKAIYNKKLETFELFGDVLIIKDNQIKTKSEYAFINMKNDLIRQNPTFLLDLDSNIWIDTNEVEKDINEFTFGSAVISSCDCVNPMWSLRFTSGYYDINDKFIHAFNARLYIKSVPILYTPYFGFSTDTTRRTGLLKPTVGYSAKEGFVYSQSMYFAPEDNYDIELRPQFRGLRGNGIYAYLRYKDSIYSSLNIKTGIFSEKNGFYRDSELVNNNHYGWDINYERSNLFSNNKENKDALFISISYLNDIEYITLENSNNDSSTNKKVESKINYYFDQPSVYFGTYLRYYLDRSIVNNKIIDNDKTLQKLPEIQGHKYLDSLFTDNFTYSLDASFRNNTRQDGLNANISEVVLPMSLNFSLFDDYVNLNIKEELFLSKTNYSNTNKNLENGLFSESRQIINISSDLIKPYSSFIHAITLSSKFTFVDNLKREGDLYRLNGSYMTDSELSSFSVSPSQKNIALSLNQSFFSQTDLKQIVNHKISQNLTYGENDELKLSNLENEITINYDKASLYNRLLYSNEDKRVIEISSNIKNKFSNFDIDLGHYKSIETNNSNKENLESFTLDLDYKISNKYYIKYSQNYNIEDNLKSKESITFGINELCWDLSFKFENELVPSSSNNETIRQNIIYFNLVLKPIGAVKQQYKIRE